VLGLARSVRKPGIRGKPDKRTDQDVRRTFFFLSFGCLKSGSGLGLAVHGSGF